MSDTQSITCAFAPDVFDPDCPSRAVLEHLTGKWGVLVLGALLRGTRRFGELRREVGGVSEKMLAQTLRTLERDGLVHREVRPVIPPHVDYSLTPRGRQAAKLVRSVYVWVERNIDDVLDAQEAHDSGKP